MGCRTSAAKSRLRGVAGCQRQRLIMQQSSSVMHDQIAALARKAGFSKAGIAPIPPPGEEAPELSHFEPWIERGYAGEMEYLKRRDEANRLLRSSLRIAVPWARSVIVCAANYNADGAQIHRSSA